MHEWLACIACRLIVSCDTTPPLPACLPVSCCLLVGRAGHHRQRARDGAGRELQCRRAGVVNGVQGSAQMAFRSLSFVAGLFVWQPQVRGRERPSGNRARWRRSLLKRAGCCRVFAGAGVERGCHCTPG